MFFYIWHRLTGLWFKLHNTAKCRYKTVQLVTILHTTLWKQWQKYIWFYYHSRQPIYRLHGRAMGVYLVRISEKIDSVITAPHCNMVDNICGKGYLTSRNAYICIRDFYEMQIPYTISLFNTNDSWRYIKDSLHRTVAIHLITTVQRAIPDGHGDGLSHRTTHAERTSGHLMLRTYILWFIYQVWRLPFMDFSSTKQLYAWFSPFIYPPVCLSNL